MATLTFEQGIKLANLLGIKPPIDGFSFESFKKRAMKALAKATPAQPDDKEKPSVEQRLAEAEEIIMRVGNMSFEHQSMSSELALKIQTFLKGAKT
jgi:hypothetical protein